MTLADSASIDRTVKALAAAGVETVVVENREAAQAQLIEWIPTGSEVFVNTSETLATIGYSEFMHGNPDYVNLHDAMVAVPDPAEQREYRRKTSIAEYFVGSVQAIAETGEIVIASSSGSQISAYAYGAKRVVLVAGIQKICPTLADAIERVRGHTPGAARPLAGATRRRPHPHRQADDHGTRARARPRNYAAGQREPGLVTSFRPAGRRGINRAGRRSH